MNEKILKDLPHVELLLPYLELKKTLKEVQEIDQAINGYQSRWGWLSFLTFCLGAYGVYLYTAAYYVTTTITVAAASGIVSFFFCFMTYRYYSNINIDDDKIALSQELVNLIGEDVKTGNPIDFHLFGGEPMASDNYLKEGVSGPWTLDIYHNLWLAIGMELSEGSKISLKLTEIPIKKHRVKVNFRGKRKYKVKYMAQNAIEILFKPGKRSMQTLENLDFLDELKFNMPNSYSMKTTKVKKGAYSIKLISRKMKGGTINELLSKKQSPIVRTIIQILSKIVSQSESNGKFIKKQVTAPV